MNMMIGFMFKVFVSLSFLSVVYVKRNKKCDIRALEDSPRFFLTDSMIKGILRKSNNCGHVIILYKLIVGCAVQFFISNIGN